MPHSAESPGVVLVIASLVYAARQLQQDTEKLSFQDQWRFSLLWIVDMRNREHEYLQYKAGVLDRETWDSYRQILRFSLGFERDKKWWNSVARETFAPEFVKMVDDFVGGIPEVDYIEALGNWE